MVENSLVPVSNIASAGFNPETKPGERGLFKFVSCHTGNTFLYVPHCHFYKGKGFSIKWRSNKTKKEIMSKHFSPGFSFNHCVQLTCQQGDSRRKGLRTAGWEWAVSSGGEGCYWQAGSCLLSDTTWPGRLKLTASPSCQEPLGNHLPQQFDYLFLSKDALMVLSHTCPPQRLCLSVVQRICYYRKRDEKLFDLSDGTEMIFTTFVFLYQGIAGKAGPRGQRGPTVGNSAIRQHSSIHPHKLFIVLKWKSPLVCSCVWALFFLWAMHWVGTFIQWHWGHWLLVITSPYAITFITLCVLGSTWWAWCKRTNRKTRCKGENSSYHRAFTSGANDDERPTTCTVLIHCRDMHDMFHTCTQ